MTIIMANGQFTIPESQPTTPVEPIYEAQQTAAFSARMDARQYTPETQPTAYHFVKEIEARLESYRASAIAIEESKHKWLRSVKSLIITPKPIMAELIESESKIGGMLFQKQYPHHDIRFWEKDGGWFCGYSDGAKVKLEDTTIHYDFTDTAIQKMYQGRTLPMVPGEESNLLNAVREFEHAVVHELYPFDEALLELKKDDDRLAA
jgi:hypothetical protein